MLAKGLPLLLLLLCSGSVAMYSDRTITTAGSGLWRLTSYGFFRGGRANVSLSIDTAELTGGTTTTTSVELLLMNSEGIPSRRFGSFASYCGVRDQFTQVSLSVVVGMNDTASSSSSSSTTVTKTTSFENGDSWQSIVILICPEESNNELTYRVQTHLSNPNTELSSSQSPLLVILPIMTVVWVVLGAIWGVNWVMHRDQKQRLHLVITIWPFANLVYLAVASGFYHEASVLGVFAAPNSIASEIFLVLSEAALFMALLLIARGYGIVNPTLSPTWKIILAGMLCGFATVRWLAAFVGGPIFILLPIIVLVIIFVTIMYQTSQTIDKIENAQNNEEDGDLGARQATVVMLKRFRWVMLTYIVVFVFLSFVDLFLAEFEWIGTLLLELEEIAVAIVIGIIFRLRKANLYYSLFDEDESAGGDVAIRELPADDDVAAGDDGGLVDESSSVAASEEGGSTALPLPVAAVEEPQSVEHSSSSGAEGDDDIVDIEL